MTKTERLAQKSASLAGMLFELDSPSLSVHEEEACQVSEFTCSKSCLWRVNVIS